MDTDERRLTEAVALADASVADGGGPFGAVVVEGDVALSSGQNRVTRDNDPTAHAEVVALRAACAARGDFALPRATLFASCEPCPMCMAAVLWARVPRVVYAADRHDAARAGFDDPAVHELFARSRGTWPVSIGSVALSTRKEPFDTWLATADRLEY